MCLPYSLPSRYPDCGFQEGEPLAIISPPTEAGIRPLFRPLFIQAGRFTRWNGWSLHQLLPRERQLHKRPRVATTPRRSPATPARRCLPRYHEFANSRNAPWGKVGGLRREQRLVRHGVVCKATGLAVAGCLLEVHAVIEPPRPIGRVLQSI